MLYVILTLTGSLAVGVVLCLPSYLAYREREAERLARALNLSHQRAKAAELAEGDLS